VNKSIPLPVFYMKKTPSTACHTQYKTPKRCLISLFGHNTAAVCAATTKIIQHLYKMDA